MSVLPKFNINSDSYSPNLNHRIKKTNLWQQIKERIRFNKQCTNQFSQAPRK